MPEQINPDTWDELDMRRALAVRDIGNEPIAAAFIYSGVLASWVFLALSRVSLVVAIISSGSTFFIAFFSVWRFYWYTTKKEEDEKAVDQSSK